MNGASPEVVVDGFPRRRPRWIEIATSADHKDVGRMMIVAALGFLFIAVVELLLMRLQLAIPENTLLDPGHLQPHALALRGDGDLPLRDPAGARPLLLPGAATGGRPWHRLAAARTDRPLALYRRRDRALRRLPLHPLRGWRQPPGAALRARFPAQQRCRRLGRSQRPGDPRVRPDRDQPRRDTAAYARARAWLGVGCRCSPGQPQSAPG